MLQTIDNMSGTSCDSIEIALINRPLLSKLQNPLSSATATLKIDIDLLDAYTFSHLAVSFPESLLFSHLNTTKSASS